jgi:hypothetical protein
MRYTLVIGAMGVIGLLAGCGSDSNDAATSTPQKTVTVIEKTVTQSAPAAPAADTTTDEAPSPQPQPSKVSVPDETGERLDVAEDDLDGAGLNYTEIGGGTFGIVVKSNWTVCEQKPSAGSKVREGARVKLIVDREC